MIDKQHPAKMPDKAPADKRPDLRCALVTNMLPPYRAAFFEALAKSIDLHVVLDKLSEFDRTWKVNTEGWSFKLHVLNNRSFKRRRVRDDLGYVEVRELHLAEKTGPALLKIRPDVVISGELGLRTLWSCLYCRLRRIPLLIWYEGTPNTERQTGKFRNFLRRRLVKRAAGFLVNGKESEELLRTYEAGHRPIVRGATGVDTFHWLHETDKSLATRDALRKELGCAGVTFLFSGSLSERKGMVELIAALKAISGKPGEPFSVILVGDGKFRAALEALNEEQTRVRIICIGFLQPDELPKYYAAADWGIIPTLDDNWPLVTLEMLVAGLPQLFSLYNGAAADLCESAAHGMTFDPLDPVDFLEKLENALERGQTRVPAALREAAATFYSPDQQAERAKGLLVDVIDRN